MIIWLIGMSASGKTTIGKRLFDKLQESNEKWIFLDGDTFRHILGEDLGHTIEDRRKNAYRISRFCEYMSSQNINVLACVLSIFHDNQRYNKENIQDYKEIFIDVTFENLVKRDNKNLYKKALDGSIKDVVGVDIEFQSPYSPDLIIDNNLDSPDYDQMINLIVDKLSIEIDDKYTYTKGNLLDNPHKYQYSKFEGKTFFIKFKKDRGNSIDFFDYRLNRLNYIHKNNFHVSNFYEDSNLVLQKFLITLYLCSNIELNNYTKIIEVLIKRFEVSKKLYLTYDKDEIRKNSLEYDCLLNYPLFSLVLQRYHNISESEQKLIYLNSIIKINDIISSIKSDFIIDIEIYYAKLALDGECNILGEFL